jgi:hypothetical protein
MVGGVEPSLEQLGDGGFARVDPAFVGLREELGAQLLGRLACGRRAGTPALLPSQGVLTEVDEDLVAAVRALADVASSLSHADDSSTDPLALASARRKPESPGETGDPALHPAELRFYREPGTGIGPVTCALRDPTGESKAFRIVLFSQLEAMIRSPDRPCAPPVSNPLRSVSVTTAVTETPRPHLHGLPARAPHPPQRDLFAEGQAGSIPCDVRGPSRQTARCAGNGRRVRRAATPLQEAGEPRRYPSCSAWTSAEYGWPGEACCQAL